LKPKLFAVILLISLIAWAVPLHAASSQSNKETKPTQDYVSNDITIKDNAIQPTSPISTPRTSPSIHKNGVQGGRYSAEANGDIQILAKEKVTVKWSESEWPAFHYILDHESGSNPYAVNKTSGACGIPQALPCSKLLNVIGSLDNISGQLDWMINYIASRYGTPTKAMQFHQTHNWY
jgi:hypothetical protein